MLHVPLLLNQVIFGESNVQFDSCETHLPSRGHQTNNECRLVLHYILAQVR